MSSLLVLALLGGVDFARLDGLQAAYKFADAARLAEQLRQQRLTRDELIHVVTAQAIAAGHLRQTAEAEAFFVELLLLDPSFTLGDQHPPRVSTPFLAARRRALEAPPLKLDGTVEFDEGVTRLRLGVSGPQPLAEAVLVHWKTADGWSERRFPRQAAVLTVPQPSLEWWAELLGQRDTQTLVVGSAAKPFVATAPAPASPPAVEETREPSVVLPPPLLPAPAPASRWSTLATLGVVAAAGAATSLGVGLGFGQASRRSFEAVTQAAQVEGVIVGLARFEAESLVTKGRTEAWVANGLFIGAGVLALLAGLFWLVSS